MYPRGRERTHDQPPVFLPGPSDDISRLMAALFRPRIARLLRERGLDVDALQERLRDQPVEIQELTNKLNATNVELRSAIATQNFERAAQFRDQLDDVIEKLDKAEGDWLDSLN